MPKQKNRLAPAPSYPDLVNLGYASQISRLQTVVRLVQSGFGTASSWDNEVDSTSRGWLVYLRQLQFTLQRHRGVDRRVVFTEVKIDTPVADAWQRVFSAAGLAREGTVAGGAEGGTLDLVTADGDRLRGRVEVWNPPKDLVMIIAGWNDAHLWVEIGPAPRAKMAKLTLSLYGVEPATADAIERRWLALLPRVFADVART